MLPPIVNHLFLTPRFLAKGSVATGDQRLSSLLASYGRPFLTVDNLTLMELGTGRTVTSAQGQLRVSEVVFAHEFVGVTGDAHRRVDLKPDPATYQKASLFLTHEDWEVFGRIRREAFRHPSQSGFLVILEPEIHGPTFDPKWEVAPIGSLPYVILNGDFIQCLFRHD